MCVELAFVFLATPLTFLALRRVTAVKEAIAILSWLVPFHLHGLLGHL